ncbi:2Fe-2S iron-sulfur cluster-binding protein [Marimonas arenosa]|uniref:2Fe-2S iron-sulfur cluster-binding protein n=1 Tax=Marimonas arenosa TaxID=1795305 RepID=A0AAE3WG14_9RHOB|nr:2Fe-2S iron-sulfur cluster-binding protein [Marimonas arenosa]MDQ2091755.1 2Fe-2S iron-sulfur cluster-binding protein [Marimonas arenosa]
MKVTFELADGTEIKTDAGAGMTLKDVALAASVPNITGDCGGNLSCATCHVVVPEDWVEKVGGPGEIEDEMLDVTMAPREATSRLSCQIEITEALDGLRVRVPE